MAAVPKRSAARARRPSEATVAEESDGHGDEEFDGDNDGDESTAQAGGSGDNALPRRAKSCAECRRLKLRCERGSPPHTWPCLPCQRRQCGALCPGSTATVSKKAATERMLRHFRSRVSELEQSLAQKQAQLDATTQYRSNGMEEDSIDATAWSGASDERPIFPAVDAGQGSFMQPQQQDFLMTAMAQSASSSSHPQAASTPRSDSSAPLLPTPFDVPATQQQPFAMPSSSEASTSVEPDRQLDLHDDEKLIASRNGASYLGRSAGPLFSHTSPSADRNASQPPQADDDLCSRAHREVLPAYLADALRLLEVYAECITWMYTPIDVEQVRSIVLAVYSRQRIVGRDELCLVCFALALGALFASSHVSQARYGIIDDHGSPRTEGNSVELGDQSTRLFSFAYAQFSNLDIMSGLLSRPTLEWTCAAHLCTSYLLSYGETPQSNVAWQVLGMGIRLSVAQGFHRNQDVIDGASSTTMLRQHAQNRAFWELMLYERLQSLNFGRPALLPTNVTAHRPFSTFRPQPGTAANPNAFHAVKYDLCKLYSDINDVLSKDTLPAHTVVMELDARVRALLEDLADFLRLDRPCPAMSRSTAAIVLPQRHMLFLLVHKALLFLHRPFFMQAIRRGERRSNSEPMLSPVSASFAAAFTSAREHTLLFQSGLQQCPRVMSWWFFVFHLYTAALVQAQIPLCHPTSILSEQSQADFHLSCQLMAQAAKFSSLGKRAYELLVPLQAEVRNSVAGRRVAGTVAHDSSLPLSYILTSEAASTAAQDSTMATDWTTLDPLFQAALYWCQPST